MRIITTIAMLACHLLLVQAAYGQCNSSQYFETVRLNTNCVPTEGLDAYAGEYTVFKTPQANRTYEFYSAVATDYLTIRDSATNNLLVHGVGPLTYTTGAVPPGSFKFIVNTNASCGTDFSPHDRFVRCVTCAATSFPSCVTNFQPVNGSTVPTLSPTLLWNSHANAYSYDIYLSSMTGGCAGTVNGYNFVKNVVGTTNTTTTLTGLANGTTYRWYVVPKACDGTPAAGGCVSNSTCFTTFAAPPVNDSCKNATTLTVNPTCSFTSATALNARDENATGDCTNASNQYTVWYRFNATATTQTVTVQGAPGFDPVLRALTACNTNTSPVGGNCSDVGEANIEVMNLSGLTIGNTYFVQVYDWFGNSATPLFDICVSAAPILPIRLSSFTAVTKAHGNLLTWTTESEKNSLSFQVERSANGWNDWQRIGEQDAKGNSQVAANYSFEDNNPLPVSYYRLLMLDRDGATAYSPIRQVSQGNGGNWAQVYPNPFRNSMRVDLELNTDQWVHITVTDLKGNDIYGRRSHMDSGAQYLDIATEDWPQGLYFVRMESQQGVSMLKMLKE